MTSTYTIILKPTNVTLTAPAGAPLRDLLFEQGVEFPCGGRGRCRGCRVRVLAGEASVNPAQADLLSSAELEAGWRLACQLRLEGDLTLELRQWDAAILGDDAAFSFTPRPGLGVAIDVGTTTLVAQLLNLETGQVLAVRTALNPQARHGADVMNRVGFAVMEEGQPTLQELIRDRAGKLVRDLVFAAQVDVHKIVDVTLVGNTVMHHLFCGVDLEPLSHYPFEAQDDGLKRFASEELGWTLADHASVRFLPCLGGFVGSDILAGILATGMHERDELAVLVDLGTNGEIVLGNREGMICASTAAGPAFEGAGIVMGMRAATGAVAGVTIEDGAAVCRILGNITPVGICGSGLVDAVACGLDLGVLLPSGRFANGEDSWTLVPPVALSQHDIRQLQLAKGAIAAGMCILLDRQRVTEEDVTAAYLAGAFGNYVSRASAYRIGLLRFPPSKVRPMGNTALLGAKMALFAGEQTGVYAGIRRRMRHISLNEDPEFMEIFVEEMGFPRNS